MQAQGIQTRDRRDSRGVVCGLSGRSERGLYDAVWKPTEKSALWKAADTTSHGGWPRPPRAEAACCRAQCVRIAGLDADKQLQQRADVEAWTHSVAMDRHHLLQTPRASAECGAMIDIQCVPCTG